MSSQKEPGQSGFDTQPFEAQVTSVNPNKEQLRVDSPTGPDTVYVPHPALSLNSWIRFMPEKGSRILEQVTAGGTFRRVSVGYCSRSAADYISRYASGHTLYRSLQQGEYELLSRGVAHVHGTAPGVLRLRGGLVQGELDPKKLWSRWRAPTHARELHEHTGTVEDLERFGVVVRTVGQKKHSWIRAPGVVQSEETVAFAKEYLRIFGRTDGKRLAAYQEGDIFGKDGNEIKAWTGKRTRAYREYYDGEGNVKYQYEIDEAGNFRHEGAAEEIHLTEASARATADLDQLAVNVKRGITISAGTNIEETAKNTARFGGDGRTIIGSQSATDQAILGTTMVQTVLVPLLTALVAHFQAAQNSSLPGDYKNLCSLLRTAISALLPLLVPSLSTNVYVGR